MLILVAFSFTLLPIAIALFMLAVLVITRVCSTSNIGGALGGGGGYIPEGLEGALHPGYKFFGSTRASKTSISRQKLKDSLGGKIIAVGDILSMFMSFIYSMNRVIIWVSFQGSLCSVTQSFFKRFLTNPLTQSEWPGQKFYLQYDYNIKQKSGENQDKYKGN